MKKPLPLQGGTYRHRFNQRQQMTTNSSTHPMNAYCASILEARTDIIAINKTPELSGSVFFGLLITSTFTNQPRRAGRGRLHPDFPRRSVSPCKKRKLTSSRLAGRIDVRLTGTAKLACTITKRKAGSREPAFTLFSTRNSQTPLRRA